MQSSRALEISPCSPVGDATQTDIALSYEEGAFPYEMIFDESLFEYSGSCPLKCLFMENCESASYFETSYQDNNEVLFDSGSDGEGSLGPWQVEAVKNKELGYSYSMCVKCTNGYYDGYIPNWSIT